MPGLNWWKERVRLGERLLDEVLGVGGVAGHPHRGGVELVEERQRVALEAGGALGSRSRWRRRSRRPVVGVGCRGRGRSSSPSLRARRGAQSRPVTTAQHATPRRRLIPAPSGSATRMSRPPRAPATPAVASTTIAIALGLAVSPAAPRHPQRRGRRRARREVDIAGRGNSSGRPNVSRSPWTTSVGYPGPRARGSRDFSGLPGGCSGNDRPGSRRRPARAPTGHADRAPADRPPTTSGVRIRSFAPRRLARRRGSAGAVATLRPATRHGCSSRTTVTPWRGRCRASAARSRASMPPPAPWLSSSVANGCRARSVDQPRLAVRRVDAAGPAQLAALTSGSSSSGSGSTSSGPLLLTLLTACETG